jgi:hypothetical protein
MDDTIVVATSRERMSEKLAVLKQAADDIGMVIHPSKSRFMCVNTQDHNSFMLDNIEISHTHSYIYLGTPISPTSLKQVEDHINSKIGHVFKFTSFLMKNSDAPFSIKRTVWDSALKSSLFYSCETWLTEDLKCAESVYMSTLKNLLSVRLTTCNDLVLVELGMSNAKSHVRQKQSRFLHKVMSRDGYQDSILAKVITLAVNERTRSGMLLKSFMDEGPNYDFITENRNAVYDKVQVSSSSHRVTYRSINPDLKSPDLYTCVVQEHYRVACTRLRLASHRLRVETGRWSRIPLENRLCSCGLIQT